MSRNRTSSEIALDMRDHHLDDAGSVYFMVLETWYTRGVPPKPRFPCLNAPSQVASIKNLLESTATRSMNTVSTT